MSTLRIALAQTNTTTGDLDGNAANIIDWATRASIIGADVVAFGQQVLTGHPVEGLTQRAEFVDAVSRRLDLLARELNEAGLGEMPVIVGCVRSADDEGGVMPEAAVIHNGTVVARSSKSRSGAPVVRVNDTTLAVTIADTLNLENLRAAKESGAGLVIHTTASPFVHAGDDRASYTAETAAAAGLTVASVNLSGAQDGVVFDGGSVVVDASGEILARGNQFGQELVVADVEAPETTANAAVVELSVPARRPGAAQTPAASLATPDSALGQLWAALTLGIADYADKNGFATAMLGLSGGIDSAVVAVLAADALGAHRVHAVSMPSQNSSQHSKTDAQELAKRLGATYSVEPIQPIVDTYLSQLAVSGLAVENMQARVRGVILMSLSNQDGHLVLSPGNRSEAAVGYATLYGDMVGGYAPIADVPKTLVYALAQWRNDKDRMQGHTPLIPDTIINKAPSAELAPGQVDTDSLPEYEVLDPIIAGYLDEALGAAALVAQGHDPQLVDRVLAMIDKGEYKRRQGAPFTRISPAAHRDGASLPITNRFRRQRLYA